MNPAGAYNIKPAASATDFSATYAPFGAQRAIRLTTGSMYCAISDRAALTNGLGLCLSAIWL